MEYFGFIRVSISKSKSCGLYGSRPLQSPNQKDNLVCDHRTKFSFYVECSFVQYFPNYTSNRASRPYFFFWLCKAHCSPDLFDFISNKIFTNYDFWTPFFQTILALIIITFSSSRSNNIVSVHLFLNKRMEKNWKSYLFLKKKSFSP